MTESLIEATADRLFADHISPRLLAAAEQGQFASAAWREVEEAGLPRALVPEEAGGFGMPAAEALSILRIAGKHAVPLPLAETMAACWLLAGAGLGIPEGPLSIAPAAKGAALTLSRRGTSWHLGGTAPRIPWGRDAVAVAVLAEHQGTAMVASVAQGAFTVTPGANLAREPRDTLTFDATLAADAVAPAAPGTDGPALHALGAAMRSLQMAGAMAALLDMTTRYALDRTQFGKPIGKFQAIQHSLAILGSHQAAAGAAATGAAEAVGDGLRWFPIAVAKVRTGEAAGLCAGLAHQVHGAIGFTYEHTLHFLTKRLLSWRNEFGNEAEWSLRLGHHLAAAGPDRLWSEITAA
ncbi:MAG: acyl-CoA dehydrogenase family protein [Acetobacteraceae bacterium]|nr:acyl-CoA dehydrogenase family protein [Acetobacteraceae bacterium]